MEPPIKKIEEMRVADIPDPVLETIMRDVANYTVGFVRIEETPQGPNLVLLGSGTLVSVQKIYAILTAHHVVRELPRTGQLGLIVSERLNDQIRLSTEGLQYLEIARGTKDQEGPDLGAVILPPAIGSSLGAIKSFHNLDLRREDLLNHPPTVKDGLWTVQGFVGEWTAEEAEPDMKVVRFYQLSSFGIIEREYTDGAFDYFSVPVKHSKSIPKSYGGTSGGGLWQVRLGRKKSDAEIVNKAPVLSGLAFYQKMIDPDRSVLTCHGRHSIYQVVYERILKTN